MSLVDTDEAVFSASYKVIRIHDYALPDQPGTAEALAAASRDHVASSDLAIIVVCAEDLLKVRLTVALHDEPVDVDHTPWEATHVFHLPFPSARLHAGDGFGAGVVMDMINEGDYAVIVQYRGREAATRTLERVWHQATMLPSIQAVEHLDRWAGTEEYRLTLYPSI
jgi:hypothetical protein